MITIGPSRYSRGGHLRFGYYMPTTGDKHPRLAMFVDGPEGREYVATVNIPEAEPADRAVWLKDWGPCEGIPQAFEKAGVVQLTEQVHQCGMELALRANLTAAALAELAEQNPRQPPP